MPTGSASTVATYTAKHTDADACTTGTAHDAIKLSSSNSLPDEESLESEHVSFSSVRLEPFPFLPDHQPRMTITLALD